MVTDAIGIQNEYTLSLLAAYVCWYVHPLFSYLEESTQMFDKRIIVTT